MRQSNSTSEQVSVNIVSTPDTPACGIGTYTGYLRRHLSEEVAVSHTEIRVDEYNPLHYFCAAIRAGLRADDIVHVQHEYGIFGPKSIFSWIFFPALYIITWLRGIPLIVTVHEAWSEETIESKPYSLKCAYVYAVNAMLVALATHLVFLSEAVYEEFSSTVTVKSTTQFPHGVVFEHHSVGTQSECKQRFGYDKNDKLVVEPGYVSKQKGQDVFVSLAEKFEDIEFLIAGGSRSTQDETFIEEIRASLPDNATMTGVLEDQKFHAAFQAADAVVLPYRKDGQSGVFSWCASYSVPVAGSRCSYFTSLESKYGCVELFEISDILDAERSVEQVLFDEQRRAELIEGLASFNESESFDKVASAHADLYHRMKRGDRCPTPEDGQGG